mgnify:CR=1 FL=1
MVKSARFMVIFLFFASWLNAQAEVTRLGVLQGSPEHASALSQAGIDLVVFDVSWQRFEPKEGEVDPIYLKEVLRALQTFQDLGMEVILDLGMQYPPAWLFEIPQSRYQNQYGDIFIDQRPGMHIANSIFNKRVRMRQNQYIKQLFASLGSDFYAVRLGGGWYGELNYPPNTYEEKDNCYWAFDANAQGKQPGLPEGIPVCPVPGWVPGRQPVDSARAELFLEWYLSALQNYHDWQIETVRRYYQGDLLMLYPSWGIRPGQAAQAVEGGLSGDTPAEQNGEVQRGFDFARFISGIRDPKVILHTTWADSDPRFGNDDGLDPSGWSPLRFLSSLAEKHPLPLRVSGENTGGGGSKIMALCAERSAHYQASIFLWAFESDLFKADAPGPRELKNSFPASQ